MTAKDVPKKPKNHGSKKGKKKDKAAMPRMTKEERRAKFLKHNKAVRVNKPGSHKRVVCFGCRKPGHRMEKCPEKDQATHICFNCGSERHALRDCPQPYAGDDLPFAQCFVCGTQGHLSSKCPQNTRGLYPNGGCCFRCKGVDHLSHACPLKPKAPEQPTSAALVDSGSEGEGPRPSKPNSGMGGGGKDIGKAAKGGAREERGPSAAPPGSERGGRKAKPPLPQSQSWKAVGGDDLGDGDFALEDFMERGEEEEKEERQPRPQQRRRQVGRPKGGKPQQQQAPGVSAPAPTGARKPATRVVTF